MRRTFNRHVYVEGGEDIARQLREMGADAERILETAAQEGAKVSLEYAKQKVRVKTGNLKNSLYIKSVKLNKKGTRAIADVTYGDNAYYGKFIELGTKKMVAKPFLRPAIYEKTREIGEAVNKAVLEALGRFIS